MLTFGSSTVYKMVVKDDGSPNWIGIAILAAGFLVVFVWRCMFFTPEYWVAVRKRFNRVVRDKNGMPVEYDPLALRADGSGKQVRGVRFRFYLINSLHPVNCGDRETDLDIDSITIGDYDFETKLTLVWNVSRQPGCPTKSFLRPAETGWKWKTSKDELESLIKRRMSNAVLRVYASKESQPITTPVRLPMLDLTAELKDTCVKLFDDYGVECSALLYGQSSVSPARRKLEGDLAIAESNKQIAAGHHDVADAIRTVSQAPSMSESDDGPEPTKLASI